MPNLSFLIIIGSRAFLINLRDIATSKLKSSIRLSGTETLWHGYMNCRTNYGTEYRGADAARLLGLTIG